MFKSRPTTAVSPTYSVKRKDSTSHSISTKATQSQTRLLSAYSHRPSIANIKPDTPSHEPSSPPSLNGSTKFRPFSRGPKGTEISESTTFRSPREARGHLTCILEGQKKPVKGPSSQMSLECGEELKSDVVSEYDISRYPSMPIRSQATPRTTVIIKKGPAEQLPQTPKISFLDVVSKSLREKRKTQKVQEELQKMMNYKEKQELVAHTIRHSDIELTLKNEEDIEAVIEYENEILGTYRTYRDVREITSEKILKKIHYLKLLRLKLREEDKQEAVMTMIICRRNTKKMLETKELETVIQELKKVLKAIIKLDDVELLMEILHLISETYLDFGNLDNSVFAYNQLRMGAELADNIPKKIDALIGLGETCKRLNYFDMALQFLKRALNFCWNVLDRDRELKVYDEMGLIYFTTRDIDKAIYYHNRASQGKTEKENSALFRLANRITQEYRLAHHLCLHHIAPVFFTRLSIPVLQKKNPTKVKERRERLRALLMHPDKKEEGYFEEEAALNHVSAFIEKVMNKVHYKKGITKVESPHLFNAGNVEAIYQLEVLLSEPDFEGGIPSPRSFDIKEKLVPEKPTKTYEQIRNVQNEGNMLGSLDKRRKVIDAREYHNLKKDRKKYSLNQIAKENHLALKSPDGEVITSFEKKDLFITFDTFKQRAKKRFLSDAVDTKLFLNHLSPNRTTHGMPNIPELKPSKYRRFFEKALEHIIYEGEELPEPNEK